MYRRLLVLMCAVLMLPSISTAAEWTFASSDHFEIYTTGGGRRAREALTYFERVHAFFADFLQLTPRTSRPTRLILFSGSREFGPYQINKAAIAYYQQGPDRDYIVMESLGDEAYPIVVHEYAHLIMQHSGANYPLWLNEGFAEFFSTLTPFGGQMNIGRVPLGRLLYLASGERMFDLERLFSITHDSPEYRLKDHAGVFYSESWALTHMLMTDERYRPGVATVIERISAGTPAATVLTEEYKTPLDQIFRDLNGYVRGDRFRYLSVNYKSPPAGVTFPERKVDAFEAGLVTANLLAARRDGREAARAAYAALSGQNPDDVGLLEARAYLEFRDGKPDAARPFFARAIDRGSRNADVYRDYAMLVEDPVQAEPLLRTALNFEPGDARSRQRLAFLLLNRREPGEALVTLAPLTKVTAEDAFNVAQLRSTAYLQLGSLVAAQAAAKEASDSATTDSQRDYARSLLQNVENLVRRQAERQALLVSRAESRGPAVPGRADAQGNQPETVGDEGALDGRDLEYVSGRLRLVTCAATMVATIVTENATLRLAVDNPELLRVLLPAGAETTLPCGEQDRPVRAGFFRPTPTIGSTAGNLRVLDFRR